MSALYSYGTAALLPTNDIIKKTVILRYEGSSSTSMTAIQGEEDASYLSIT
jgi:hypothetical protein